MFRSIRRQLVAGTVLVTVLGVVLGAGAVYAVKVRDLPEKYQQWLEDVDYLISKKERKAFLELEKDYQRDAFIREFWEARDPDPTTPDNPFRGAFLARLEEARERYQWASDDRKRVYALNGEPSSVIETSCGRILWPLEFWIYNYSAHTKSRTVLVFFQKFDTGPFRLWRPADGYEVLMVNPRDYQQWRATALGAGSPSVATFPEYLERRCTETSELIAMITNTLEIYRQRGDSEILASTRRPQNADPEWLTSFHAFSTEADPAAPALEAELSLEYPGRHQQRTVVRGLLAVPAERAQVQNLGDRTSYNFALTGEVLRGEELFESFKMVFDVAEPTIGSEGALPVVFERWLRPGNYRLVVKLQDIVGGGVHREEREIEVPALRGRPAEPAAEEVATDGPEPAAAAGTSLRLTGEGKDLQRGYARFSAQIEGTEPDKVTFLLEDRVILTKTRPPFSVDLALGDLDTLAVRAIAYDAEGREIATDELLVNAGDYAFVLRLVEPRPGSEHSERVRVRAAVEVPADAGLDRVEFFIDDRRVTTLYQEPFTVEVELASESLTVIRAEAFLEDGNSTEAVSVVNGGFFEQVDVRLVEVFATVLDDNGRPVRDLAESAFQVLEDGVRQDLVRFEELENLPIHVGLMIDTSASMAERLAPVKEAAVRFLKQTVRSQDRAAVVTFDEKPRMAAAFTNDVTVLTGALAGLRAGSGTALYDSLLFSLYAFRGLKGQRALLLLSDGEDRRSRTTFEEVREYALRSGVTVYTLGLRQGMTRRGKAELVRLAEETGGRAFLVDDVSELDAVYTSVQQDMRSKYFLAYQPAQTEGEEFRTVTVAVDRPGHEVRALRGYVPR